MNYPAASGRGINKENIFNIATSGGERTPRDLIDKFLVSVARGYPYRKGLGCPGASLGKFILNILQITELWM
jgi:hypothetical protein